MGSCFLAWAFFCPRFALLTCWLGGALPVNDTPFIVDALLVVFMPRVLIAWWAHTLGMHPLISVLFVVFDILEKLGGTSRTREVTRG